MHSKKTAIIFTVILFIWLAFQSHPPDVHAQTNRVVFAVISDYGLAGQPAADVANLVKSWNPDFIVTSGDNNQTSRPYEMDDNIGQYYHEYIYQYKGKYGEGSPTRRFFPAIGNHDWAGDGVKSYLDYFGLRQQRYYEFVQGPVHFFMLDSDRNEPDGVDAKSEQAIWLRKALAASSAPFQVVVAHHPPYSSGRHGSTEYMRWPFKEWGADIVLSGHNHLYERLQANGLPYIVNGLGGADIYRFETVIPESLVRFNQDHGALRVEATNTYMKFQMFTRTGILVDEFMIGQGNPSVTSITSLTSSPTNADILNFQVTFSEAVTGVDPSDFFLTSNTNGVVIQKVSGSGSTYTVSIHSGSGDGTIRLDVQDDDTIVNSVGNMLGGVGLENGNFANGTSITIDRTAPTIISILRAGTTPSNAASVDFTVTFSETVTGLDNGDFSVSTNASAQVATVTGSGNLYTVSVSTGAGDDVLRLDFIDNDSVIDLAGNPTTQGLSGETYTIDRTAPTVVSITRAGDVNDASVDYAVRFSEPVTGVDGSDFILSTMNGATIGTISGIGDLYTVTVNINPGSDAIRLDVSDNDTIYDGAGNPLGGIGIGNGNFFGETIPVAIDTPIATSIIRAGANPTSAGSVDFIVTFSETVEGVDATDFVISGKPDAAILSVRSANPFYIVSVNPGASDGTLKIELLDDDSIRNADGISLGGNGIGNANFANGETYTIDRILPRVTSILRAGNNPAIHPSVDFIVTFSESVNGVDATDFSVTTTNLNAAVINIQNANPFYVVTVNTGAGSGTVRLDLLDNRSISDQAGNPLADNGMGSGTFTSGEAFTIAKIPVNFSAPTPRDINKKNLTNNPSPTLSWSAVWTAQAYEIFIARDANFAQLVAIQTTNGTSFTPSLPLPDGTYYMRVWAYNADFNPGKFSKTLTFTIDTAPPSQPKLVSPASNSSTPKRPWLTWMTVPGASQYQIEVDNSPDFLTPEFSATTNKTTIQTKTLISKRTYYWRVRASDPAGNWSDWSAVFTMIIR